MFTRPGCSSFCWSVQNPKCRLRPNTVAGGELYSDVWVHYPQSNGWDPPVISVVIHQSTRDKKRWKTWVVGYDVHHAMVFTRIRDGWTHALRHTINLGKLGDLQQKRRFHGKIIYEFVFSIGPWKKMSVQNTHRADSRNSRPFPACAFFCPIPWSCGWVSLHPKSGYIQ